ncbi:hypothetical protein CC78DRAFT_346004 [Lojkania enalia]|uniref:DUF7907 domain-containing protein n=1 Tax=Lojkania enalia TaxID=147567 RepID=A0A9P4MXQ1_9PLEO|nr:hypothetical protein CC78DRAFT_346004 [Didymosphaeria enalia]
MKLALSTLVFAFAASTIAQYDQESNPFNLAIVSKDQTIDGDTLSACHEGAAIESLCLSNSNSTSKPDPIPATVFHFNTSDTVVTPNASLGAPGYLTYLLRGGNFNVSEAMGLDINPTSNVALPLFWPSTDRAAVVSFDSNDFLNIQNYVVDTVNPPVSGEYRAYYRWYSCTTYYAGYTYVTLSWVLGEGKPQNPSCVKVNVKRVFV